MRYLRDDFLYQILLAYDISSSMKFSKTQCITASVLAVLATMASMHFIDQKVALGIWQVTSSQPFIHNHIKEIPDKLLQLVVLGTTILCLAYYITYRKNGWNIQTHFLQLAAISVPSAYLIKKFLQYAFGHTRIRSWLVEGTAIEFSWFAREGGGLPSGHAVVLTAFLTAVWLYYPKYRPLAVALLTALTMALLFTSYHFVSDIVAGVFCGALITISVQQLISRIRELKPWH